MVNLRNKAASAVLVLFFFIFVSSAAADTSSGSIQGKGPNAQVSSNDPEVRSIDSWMNKNEERPVFYNDGSTAMGFNDSGDPNVSTRF